MAEVDFVPSAVTPNTTTTDALEVTGFTLANYYSGPAGFLQGANTMSHGVLIRLRTAKNSGTLETFAGAANPFGNGGFELRKDGNRFKELVTDGVPALLENFLDADFSQSTGIPGDFSAGTYVHIVQTYSAANGGRLYVNSVLQATVNGDGGYTPRNVAYAWGLNLDAGANAFQGGMVGSALDESNEWTADQVFDHFLACRDALQFVDGGLGWEHLWNTDGLSVGAAPATIADQGSGIARDLAITGALTVASHRVFWYMAAP